MKILFTICGRAGSKGIANKNIRPFLGKLLPYYSLSAIDLYIKNYGKEGDVYDIALSTDSPELIDMIENNPFRPAVIIERSAELAGDTIGKKDVILDCGVRTEAIKGYEYDMYVDLDITSPLRTKEDVAALINKHIETGADITYSVTSARRNPYFNQVMRGENGFRKVCQADFTARQQAPVVYDMNASLYAYSPSHLKAGGGFNEGYFEAIEMYDTAVLDLDHENDFELMEIIAGYLFDNKDEFREIYENIPQ
ncbi:MAG: acylneuraminate cytidylyltransferase family protein [Lachnospiraceae bacterium]|nr:acylneuraminate cytidylyltransferase family protein [Candidatus Colinaster scatohippi]